MTNTVDNSVAPTVGDLNLNLTRIVRILMALHGMEQQHLASALNIEKSTMSRVLNGQRKWSLEEVYALAEVFDRPISYFFEPADTLVRNRCFRQESELVGAA